MADHPADHLNEAALDDIIANPEKYRKKWDEETRKTHPDMTEEQRAAAWEEVAQRMGLK